jgi:parvulin-like peptidyl-prolyl isomerase
MTLRTRRPQGGIRTRLGRLVETEERQQALVTGLFIGAIALVVLILIGAFALAWYNDNLRALARVGSVEVKPQQVRDYLRLEQFRIARDESRLTQAQIDGEIDETEAAARQQELDQREQALQTTGLDNLVDLIYQSQLAAEEGIAVSDADVDAAFASEIASQEQRHVLVINVEPQAEDEEAGPSTLERQEAMERAMEALAELQSGAEWADVAREYGTDTASQNGGDLGFVTELGVGDRRLAEKAFEVESGGTTSVILGEDGNYRIARVVEVQPAGEEPGLHSRMNENLTDQAARDLLRLEEAAHALEDRRVSEALAETPEQIRLGIIYIEGLETGDPDEAEGEIDYSEIVYAPNSNMELAPDLAEDDPAWDEAKAEADAAFAELQANTDDEELEEAFGNKAEAQSDSSTREARGRVGFVTRSIPPVAIGDALWSGEHEEFDLIGPVRGDAGWYVLLFHEKREAVATRLQEVEDALAAPDADFAEIARELSDSPQADDGGDAGWYTQQALEDSSSPEFADAVFALQAGEISEAIELGEGHYFAKALERMARPFDPDQTPGVEDSAFTNWYEEKRTAAEENGTIVIPGTTDVPDELEGGEDQP